MQINVKDLNYLYRKYPISKVVKNPTVNHPALVYQLLMLNEIGRTLHEINAKMESKENEPGTDTE